ncbi:MAG TPA: histidine phosphatase family protein [Rhizomicrobium sp.]|jgi:broad specificity phosphatase PhoE|nr:histidine phosphatase family protein [Rhizomicrobium sp.]
MAKIFMVRHGKAAAGFGEDADPGLDDVGRAQAQAVGERLSRNTPMRILSSPLKRARETAMPLAALWKREPVIEEAVGEIPSNDLSLAERATWLRGFMSGSWRAASFELAQWREGVIAALLAQKEDAVIFSHYVAINAAAGAALGDDRVIVFSPDNCSVTVFETDGTTLRLIEKGAEAPLTKVN